MFGKAPQEYPIGVDIGEAGVAAVRLAPVNVHGTQQVRVAASGWAPCTLRVDDQLRIRNIAASS